MTKFKGDEVLVHDGCAIFFNEFAPHLAITPWNAFHVNTNILVKKLAPGASKSQVCRPFWVVPSWERSRLYSILPLAWTEENNSEEKFSCSKSHLKKVEIQLSEKKGVGVRRVSNNLSGGCLNHSWCSLCVIPPVDTKWLPYSTEGAIIGSSKYGLFYLYARVRPANQAWNVKSHSFGKLVLAGGKRSLSS